METNYLITLDEQENELATGQIFNMPDEEPGDDAGNQEDYPQTDDLDDDTSDTELDDENLDEVEQTGSMEDGITDEEDPSANDVDGNGGYPDAANPAELNS